MPENIFSNVIFKLQEIGAFNFLFPYLLTTSIFYGLLRKTRIFGDPDRNVSVNGIIALVSGFMVWAFPILRGIDVETQLSTFFMQGMIVILVLMVGLMLVGMILPEDLPIKLWEKWKDQYNIPTIILILSIVIGVVIFVTSGLVSIFLTPDVIATIPSDVLLVLGIIVVLVIPLFWIMSPSGK